MLKPIINFIKQAFSTKPSSVTAEILRTATVVPRSEHSISRADISENALKVLYRLKKNGYNAFLVGGGVRDLLLGNTPKDFDVATNARPEKIKKLFTNSRLIGRRFRLAHIHFGNEIIEVATFRANHDKHDKSQHGQTVDGMITRDNVYGTLEEDAWRRDFTINALYYNIDDFSLVDYTNGLSDINERVVRIIGPANIRYQEDPVRMLRAIRFAAKLDLVIHEDTAQPIHEHKALLENVAAARLFEELLKLFHCGQGVRVFELMQEYGLLKYLCKQTAQALEKDSENHAKALLLNTLASTDERINAGKPITPAFLFAALLWHPVKHKQIELQKSSGLKPIPALIQAMDIVVRKQTKQITIPRFFINGMQDIWALQSRFQQRSPSKAQRFISHPRFRAAYDFLELRSKTEKNLVSLVKWWENYQLEHPEKLSTRPQKNKKNTRKQQRLR